MYNGKLIVSPIYGLGNRLFTIISGYIIAEKFNKKLVILWPVGLAECNAAFIDLFEIPNNVEIVNSTYPKTETCDNHPYVKNLSKKESIISFYYINELLADDLSRPREKIDFPWSIVQEKNNLVQKVPGPRFLLYESIYKEKFNSNDTLVEKISSTLKKFVPIKEISEKKITLPKNTVGIHISRGHMLMTWVKKGFKHAIEKVSQSSDERFMTNIDNIIKQDSSLKFFLATDNYEVRNLFCKKYKDKIITYNRKEIDRYSKKAMQSAVLDLITLADTKFVLGSYGSTFSAVAAWINMIPLHGVNYDPPIWWQRSIPTKVIDEYKGVKLV